MLALWDTTFGSTFRCAIPPCMVVFEKYFRKSGAYIDVLKDRVPQKEALCMVMIVTRPISKEDSGQVVVPLFLRVIHIFE